MARKSNRRLAIASALVAIAVLIPHVAAAAPSDLFTRDEPLALRLEGPIGEIVRQRANPQYQQGRIVVTGADGAPVSIDLRLRARGKSRVQSCDFPPLLLNFPKHDLDATPFHGEDRLKLVTYCNTSSSYTQYVLVEQQIYRMLAVLTDASLRVRPVVVTYFDTARQRELVTRPGFLIESEERFAKRLGVETVDAPQVEYARYDSRALALVDVFQYFIGNTDWSATNGPAGEPCCHNLVPFARPDGTLVPVPYDFDASGLVAAPYALPDARLPIKSVKQRIYRGRCRDLADLEPVFDRFIEKRAALTAVLEGDRGLTEKTMNGARVYIDNFYAVLADARKVEKEFRGSCGR